MRFGKFFITGKVDPYLKKFKRIFFFCFNQRKHFAVLKSFPCGHPLHIAHAIASGLSPRIGMIYNSFEHYSYSFETTMWMNGKARNCLSVVHAPTIFYLKILSYIASGKEVCFRTHVFVPDRIFVVVMGTKKKGI